MKFKSSNIGKAQLRREQFNRTQNKSQFHGKSSLSKRIIAERLESLTKQRIDEHNEMLELNDRLRELYDEAQYKVAYYQRLICEDYKTTKMFAEIVMKGDNLLKQFYNKEIDIRECIKGWEELNEQITNIIQNWENNFGVCCID